MPIQYYTTNNQKLGKETYAILNKILTLKIHSLLEQRLYSHTKQLPSDGV